MTHLPTLKDAFMAEIAAGRDMPEALEVAYEAVSALIRRDAMEEAADLCEERAEMVDAVGLEMECCLGTANNCADDIRAAIERADHE